MKKLQIEEIKEAIEKQIQLNERDLAVVKTIVEELKRFDGKKITKRIGTCIEKALPQFTICYSKDISMYRLKIWGYGILYTDHLSILLGYINNENDIFSHEKFIDYNQRYLLDELRNKKLRILLQFIPDAVEKCNKGLSIIAESITDLQAQITEIKSPLNDLPYPISNYFKNPNIN